MLPFASRTATVSAAVVTEVLYPSNRSALRFVTLVVDATTKGAVPVATFDSSVLATTLPDVVKLPEVVFPVTERAVRVPTLVMFGCAEVYTVPATNALPT